MALCGREPTCEVPLSRALRLATESARFRPGGLVTLHLLTLSLRFIMALWTKPPMPFVGEADRSGDVRPEGETIVCSVMGFSSIGSSGRGGFKATGEPSLPLASAREGGRSLGFSADMPGS